MKTALLLFLFACSSEDNLGDTTPPPPPSVTSTARWGITLGQTGYERALAVAIDSHGDVLVAGDGSLAAADLGNGTIGNDSVSWGYLTKRAGSDGSAIWTLPFAATNASAEISDIKIGADDSIVITGSYWGTLSFGAGAPVTADLDTFVAKYASDGTLQWLQTFGPNSGAEATSLAVDAVGNVFVGGYFHNGSFDFMGTHHAESDGEWAGFVVSYGSDGSSRWGHFFDPPARTSVAGVAMSATGDVVVSGSFSTTVSLGGDIMNPNAFSRGFVARYHRDGSYMWASAVGPFGSDSNRTDLGTVTVDARDRIIYQANEGATTEAEGESPTVTALDAAGSPQWKFSAHNNGSMPMGGLVTRADGTVVHAEWVDNFGPPAVTGSLQLRLFDLDGNLSTSSLGQRLLTNGQSTFVYSAAVGPSGEIAVVGQLGGEVLVGPGPLESHGTADTDGLVIMLEP